MAYYMDGTTQVWEPDSFDATGSQGMSSLSQFGDFSQQLQQNTLANNVWSAEQAEKANAFNAEQAELNRQFQREMSDTSYQRAVADLKAAGLNPVLAARISGASTPSGSTAQGTKGDTDTSLNGALTSLVGSFISQENARLNAQTNLAIAEKNNSTSRLIAEISAAASMNSAAMHAAATRYASDLSAETSRYVSDNSGLQVVNLIAHGLGYKDVGQMAGSLGSALGLNAYQTSARGPSGHSTRSNSSATTARGVLKSVGRVFGFNK